MTTLGMTFSSVHDDPAAEVAADALSHLIRGRQLARYEAWLHTRGRCPRVWRHAAIDNEHLLWLTAEELRELSTRLTSELTALHRERHDDPTLRPEGAQAVELLVLGYPMAPPEGGS